MLTVGVSIEVQGVHLVQLKVRELYFARTINGEHVNNLGTTSDSSTARIVCLNTSAQNAGLRKERLKITQKHLMIVPTKDD